MAKHNELGQFGEQYAMEYLVTKGYTIRETNWRCGKVEIDIVAEKDGRIVIVEVKTRSTDVIYPEDAVDRKKMLNLVRAANAYMNFYDLPHEVQFDIISIIGKIDDFELEHIPDAFLPPLKTY
ncbi:MAG: YraN family protein [Muribaculaceae bacterium]